MKLSWIFFLLVIAFRAEADHRQDTSNALVAKLQSTTNAFYYGTAQLYKIEKDTLYFVTNSHNIPRLAKAQADVRLISPVLGSTETEFELIARSPGYDLAVIATKHAFTEAQSTELKAVIEQTLNEADLPEGKYQFGLLGYPGPQSDLTPVLQGESWQEVTLRELHRILGKPFAEKAPGELSQAVALEVDSDCPMLFVPLCFRVPIRSWGYSGGALVFAQDATEEMRFAGVISHYEPLSQLTYVIPTPLVIEVADRLRREAGVFGNGVEWKGNLYGSLEYVSDQEFEILTGPLKGKHVRRRPGTPLPKVPGGSGEGVGGGESGEAVGGGSGEGVGGGGDTLLRHPFEGVTLEMNFADLKNELNNTVPWPSLPQGKIRRVISWLPSFRGAGSILDYIPGVEIGTPPHFETAFLYGNKPLWGLQDFFVGYSVLPTAPLGYKMPKAPPLPKVYSMAYNTQRSSGLHSFAGIRRKQPVAGNKDVLVSRPEMNDVSTISVVDVTREKGRFLVDLGDSSFGTFKIGFDDALKQTGPYSFRFEGPLDLVTPLADGTDYTVKAQGLVVLNYLPQEQIFEMKIISAFLTPENSVPIAGGYTRQQMTLDGFYLPLVPVKGTP